MKPAVTASGDEAGRGQAPAQPRCLAAGAPSQQQADVGRQQAKPQGLVAEAMPAAKAKPNGQQQAEVAERRARGARGPLDEGLSPPPGSLVRMANTTAASDAGECR